MSLLPKNPPTDSVPSLPAVTSLYKHKSRSPDLYRDEAWKRRRERRHQRRKSVTDDDMEELKACIELGFGFDSPEIDPRLSDTVPAYCLYYAVNKQHNDAVSKPLLPTSPSLSDCETPSPLGSPLTIFAPGENPQAVKTRLKRWAQVIACAVLQSPS